MRHPCRAQHALSPRHCCGEERCDGGADARALLDDLVSTAGEVLDRRLDTASATPLAIAVSGGADSIAALIAASSWARATGRRLLVLSVDHGLQAQSRRWTDFVKGAATRLGADFRALAWTGPKPQTGLAAAARAARHRLLAQAAREAGANVLITGHTASDARENSLLGQGVLREWSPSPVWPQGRGIFLLRPLLCLSRETIRAALGAGGIAWIDDPANDDLRQPRARARRAGGTPEANPPPPSAARLARQASFLPGGAIRIDRATLRDADPAVAQRLLAGALTSAGGGERPAQAAGVERLLERLRAPGTMTATLAGSRLSAVGTELMVIRDVGERRRRQTGPLSLVPRQSVVWDGRYLVEAGEPDLRLDHLYGYASRLMPGERAALARLPAALRPTLPVALGAKGPTCPILTQASPLMRVDDLVPLRFLGACGAIAQESELAQGAHGVSGMGVLCSTPVTE